MVSRSGGGWGGGGGWGKKKTINSNEDGAEI